VDTGETDPNNINNVTWVTSTVDAMQDCGYCRVSIALDKNDKPGIAYSEQ
jgi:hypothetical protein